VEPDGEVVADIAMAVRQLRWLITGFNMAGIGYLHVSNDKKGPADRASCADAAESSVARGARVSPAPASREIPRGRGEVHPRPLPLGDSADSTIPAPPGVIREKAGGAGLAQIRDELGECRRCRLHEGRSNLVFGEGPHSPSLVFVGEGPGFDEDRLGRPFVGRAGKLLDKMISAIGLNRGQVYICNVVKCRPPGNRTPNPDEIAVCSPFLMRQLEALNPKAICALGACAAHTLLGADSPISQLRGKVHRWHGIPLVCTYHPAYLLRSPAQKAATWKDLREILRIVNAD
jgi:uracil-DNA glycosylase family 4